MIEDPVHQNKDGKWYFWDECWSSEVGPFKTRKIAEEEINKYCKEVLGMGND